MIPFFPPYLVSFSGGPEDNLSDSGAK